MVSVESGGRHGNRHRFAVYARRRRSSSPDMSKSADTTASKCTCAKTSARIELAAVGEFDAPPAEVQAALLDYGSHPRVNKHLAESTVLARRPGELVVYQHLKLPVIKDRDFTLHVAWTEGSLRGFSFNIDGDAGPGGEHEGGAHVDAQRPLGSRADPRRQARRAPSITCRSTSPARCRAGWCAAAPPRICPASTSGCASSSTTAARAASPASRGARSLLRSMPLRALSFRWSSR